MRTDIKPLTPDDPLERAVELLAENDISELPVVSGMGERRFLGMVRRTDIARAYLRRVHAPAAGAPIDQRLL